MLILYVTISPNSAFTSCFSFISFVCILFSLLLYSSTVAFTAFPKFDVSASTYFSYLYVIIYSSVPFVFFAIPFSSLTTWISIFPVSSLYVQFSCPNVTSPISSPLVANNFVAFTPTSIGLFPSTFGISISILLLCKLLPYQ